CVASVETLDRISKEKLSVNVVGAFAAQEEVGTRGAQVAAHRVKPDFVIVFEGSPADDTFKDSSSAHGAIGKGLQFRVIDALMISNPRLIKFAREIADKNNIPYQIIAREKGSTNAGKYHVSENGIPCLVIGVPTRYIHSHFCYASLHDLEGAIKLAIEICKTLTKEKISEF
ncbi:MAG: M20/M25/M40 family metallo-hydrolase, partial [Fusobacteriaceae bacterium]